MELTALSALNFGATPMLPMCLQAAHAAMNDLCQLCAGNNCKPTVLWSNASHAAGSLPRCDVLA